ncbi:MAG: CBS domain-containing protein [Dehalogenimonas sp.]
MSQVILVKDVYLLHGTASVVVDQNTTLERLINIYATNPSVRGVFLVDEDKRFSGMVSHLAIQKWAEYQLFGKSHNQGSNSQIRDLVISIKAKDLAHGGRQSLSLKEDDELEAAFQRMVDLDEDVLPVVDEEGQVIGDLRLSEMLLKAIESGHGETG